MTITDPRFKNLKIEIKDRDEYEDEMRIKAKTMFIKTNSKRETRTGMEVER
jgi:predicted XRE-type DNA-binding protein